MSKRSIKVFCSYSHKDEEYKEELEAHLSSLKRLGLIDIWTDRRILPGDNWDLEINENLKNADIILLLVSSDFLASNYCYDVEIKQAIKQHKEKTSITIPIALRECDWYDAPFAYIQGLPTDMKPIISKNWFSKDEAYKNVSVNLKRLINQIFKKKESSQEQEYKDLPNSIEALRDFVVKYKEGDLVQKAKNRLHKLDEDNFWYNSEKSNSISAYEAYIISYPKGKYKEKALVKIAELKTDNTKSDIIDESINSKNKVEFPIHIQKQIDNLLKTISKSGQIESYRYPYNFLFVGGPGTGKTTCARELGRLLKEKGLISKGHTIETSRFDLVGQYLGQTSQKVKRVIESAVGGVLILDEAYQLLMGSSDSFGREALDQILRGMEDYSSEICFIFTGYEHEIQNLLNINPGIKRRIVSTINFNPEKFEDYLEFMDKKLKLENLRCDENTYDHIKEIIKSEFESKGENFGGFAFINLLLSKIIMNFFIRCDNQKLETENANIQDEDIPEKYRTR